ncbi:MAG TPA: ABC transporter permease [Gaiellaceae bacterium]|nr:ABC transporter permease [Gaiellaceae bacterium]
MKSTRVFFVGGLISFRALFGWLNPWVYIPSMLVAPVFQILLFVYIGRSARLQSDSFYVIGNGLQYAAIPCLFAMANTIAGERYQQTLGYILITPARRLPLFLGRALPVASNGFFVSLFALVVGGAIVGIHVPASSYAPIVLVTAVCAFSCTGLGLINAALGLVARETAVASNILFGGLLIVSGANVPVHDLPGALQAVSDVVPLTHGIEAGRLLAAGGSFSSADGLVATEALIGLGYALAGYALLRGTETISRRNATLERA